VKATFEVLVNVGILRESFDTEMRHFVTLTKCKSWITYLIINSDCLFDKRHT